MTMRSTRGPACALAVCLAVGAVSGSAEGPPGPPPSDLESHIEHEEQDLETRMVGLGRVRLSVPQHVSGSLGMLIARQPGDFDCTTVCEYRGALLQVEPGLAGGQVSAGYAVVVGELGDNDHFLSNVFLGYGVKAALMRTWGDSSLSPPEQTLLGIEGSFTVIRINISLALFRPVGSDDFDDPWIVGGGLGWGF
jgi:hypothetical protein